MESFDSFKSWLFESLLLLLLVFGFELDSLKMPEAGEAAQNYQMGISLKVDYKKRRVLKKSELGNFAFQYCAKTF